MNEEKALTSSKCVLAFSCLCNSRDIRISLQYNLHDSHDLDECTCTHAFFPRITCFEEGPFTTRPNEMESNLTGSTSLPGSPRRTTGDTNGRQYHVFPVYTRKFLAISCWFEIVPSSSAEMRETTPEPTVNKSQGFVMYHCLQVRVKLQRVTRN